MLASVLYAWFFLPLMIFMARVADVTLGTVRVIFVSRGMKYLAPLIGFVEILIWLMAIGHTMQNLTNPACYVAYAGGFAMGNFVGITIAERLSLGVVMIRVITAQDALPLVQRLKTENYGVTSIDGHGSSGQVKVVFTVVPRREVSRVIGLIKTFNPRAFYSVEEVNFVEKGVFPLRKSWRDSLLSNVFGAFRKGK